MGFGHRVYRAEDPRARHLRDRAQALGEKKGEPRWFQILSHLEQKTMLPYRDRGICVNVDFFAGAIYYLLDIPDDLFISIFALGRIPGWTPPVRRAVPGQHPDTPAAGVHRRNGSGVRADRGSRVARLGFNAMTR